MKLRTRLALVTALAVAVAVVVVASVTWLSTRRRLVQEIDRSLSGRSRAVAEFLHPSGTDDVRPPDGFVAPPVGNPFGEQDTSITVLDATGAVVRAPAVAVPIDAKDRASARAGSGSHLRSLRSDGRHLRVRVVAVRGGGAVVVARDLDETDRTLRGLGFVLGGVSIVGVASAALVGRSVARRALRPIDALTDAAERVAATQELTTPVEGGERGDEVGRLAASFNAMLSALAESRGQQQQLVTDASHELRTPLTSLRTAIELLQRAETMPPDQRRELIDHAVAELGELTHLVSELVDLATDARAEPDAMVDTRLDELVADVVERAARRSGLPVSFDAQPWLVHGHPALLQRAVGNLVDNACKWSPPGAPVEVSLRDGEVRVRDRGPGVPADERERVFERFARGRDAQAVAGSGLGLAIVRQIAAQHDGAAWLEAPPGGDSSGGGTVAVLRVPGEAPL